MITKVKLKNWRSHLNSELIFSKGINALLGPIGVGKTSVLDCICFALFGTFPALQSKKIRLDDVIMSKPTPKDKAEVECEFLFNNKTYFIKRIVERGKGTTYSEIREDGKLLEAPNSFAVTEVVEKTLKVNYDLFTKAVYSEQNEIDYFLTLSRGKRKEKFDELLMLDKFEKARTNTVTLINRVADRKIGIQSVIKEIDVEQLERELKNLKDSLEKIINEKEEFKKILNDVINKKNLLEKEVKKFKEIKEVLEKLRQKESGIKGAIEEISNSIKVLEEELKGKKIDEIEEELKRVKEKLSELEIRAKDINLRYRRSSALEAGYKSKLESLKENVEKLEKEVEEKLRVKRDFESYKDLIKTDIEKEMGEKRKIYEKALGELESLKFRISETEGMLNQLTKVKDRCPLCQSKLDRKTAKMLIQQKEQNLRALKEEMENVLKIREKAELEVRELEALKKKWDEMQLELRDLEEKQAELQKSKELVLEINESWLKTRTQVENLEEEINKIDVELKESNELKSMLEILLTKFRDYEGKKVKLVILKKEEEKIRKDIDDVEAMFAGKNLEEMERELIGLVAKVKEYEGNVLRCEQLAEERAGRVKEYEKKLEEAKKQKEEIKRLEKILGELKIFQQALVATQVELREELIGGINYFMNKIWSTLYPYRDFIGIRLAVEENDYILQLQERSGRFVAADGIASGGERSIACLALRMAFSTVLAPQLRLLVLDEPSHNLDVASLKELARTLRERISDFIDQVFLITHQTELEEAVTGMAYRLERDKAHDGITQIIELV